MNAIQYAVLQVHLVGNPIKHLNNIRRQYAD